MRKERRCSRCGLLLAMEVDDELVVRTQKHQYMFSGGTLRAVCARCGALEVLTQVGQRSPQPESCKANI